MASSIPVSDVALNSVTRAMLIVVVSFGPGLLLFQPVCSQTGQGSNIAWGSGCGAHRSLGRASWHLRVCRLCPGGIEPFGQALQTRGENMSPVAIVTASDSGIGQESAKELAESGFDLGITYRMDEAGARETLEAVRAAGRRGEMRRLDLTELPGAADVIDDLADSLGGVDVLVNNAGTGDPTGEFLELSYEEWRQVIDTNLSGAFLCAQRAARHMVDAGNGGRIINITSVHEHIPRTGASAYCASKSGLGLLTKVMAMELAEYGILVNAVGPGEISTPMTGAEDEDPATIERSNLPLGRPGHTREIAAWVAFLAPEKSTYATGASLVVGGLMLMAAELSSRRATPR